MTPCCTSLDHVYPSTVAGTPCYCGARTWAGVPRVPERLSVGQAVRVHVARAFETAARRVTEVIQEDGETFYRVDAPVAGWALFDRDDLDVIPDDHPESVAGTPAGASEMPRRVADHRLRTDAPLPYVLTPGELRDLLGIGKSRFCALQKSGAFDRLRLDAIDGVNRYSGVLVDWWSSSVARRSGWRRWV